MALCTRPVTLAGYEEKIWIMTSPQLQRDFLKYTARRTKHDLQKKSSGTIITFRIRWKGIFGKSIPYFCLAGIFANNPAEPELKINFAMDSFAATGAKWHPAKKTCSGLSSFTFFCIAFLSRPIHLTFFHRLRNPIMTLWIGWCHSSVKFGFILMGGSFIQLLIMWMIVSTASSLYILTLSFL